MASKALPSPEVLRQLLRYEPDTGKLFWLPRPPDFFTVGRQGAHQRCAIWNGHFAGKQAVSSVASNGYLKGRIFDRDVLAHRVIWALVTEKWPVAFIDHKDGDPANNRWSNLREATPAQNQWNKRTPSTNTSGAKGVTWEKTSRTWQAAIVANGRSMTLGRFANLEDAKRAYASASARFHGEFGRLA